MMYQKALLMGDTDTGALILATKDPKKIKQLGQRVKPWDESKWLENRCRIMYEGLMGKFTQNTELKERLLSTGQKILVEASPLDKIWGIGLDGKSPDARHPLRWKGLNLLGRVLMQVREDLRMQELQ